jgi:hypothetical protein
MRYYNAMMSRALKSTNGTWPDSAYGSEYATSMASIILQMSNNYLPIFKRWNW